jgi:hypothetical protein
MIINKKYVRENCRKTKYLFSYQILVLGWPLSPTQHITGRKRDEATRYI